MWVAKARGRICSGRAAGRAHRADDERRSRGEAGAVEVAREQLSAAVPEKDSGPHFVKGIDLKVVPKAKVLPEATHSVLDKINGLSARV